MIDLSTTHNPYDFANPVADADLFVGRRDELEEIRYYLDHARTAPRPINLAILGARASGKTSLLNMVALEATKRDFVSPALIWTRTTTKLNWASSSKSLTGCWARPANAGFRRN